MEEKRIDANTNQSRENNSAHDYYIKMFGKNIERKSI